jgi:ABC-type sugar transport system substrate-binding protein
MVAACGSGSNGAGGNADAGKNTMPANDTSGNGGNAAKDTKIKVGMTIPDSTHPFFIFQINELKKLLEKENGELIVAGANSDVNKQINDIENFVESKVQVILVNAMEPKSVEAALKKAQQAGVKVIAYGNDDMPYADVTQTISHKQVGTLSGENAAKWIHEKLGGQAEVGLLVMTGNPSMAARSVALEEAIRKNAPNAKIVSKQEATTMSNAQQVAENMLTANPNMQVIATVSDTFGLGAYEAVKAAGRANDKFFINGTDGTPEALAKIKEGGAFRATLDMETAQMPQITLSHILKLAKNEPVDKVYNSKLTVIDANNIDNYLKK